MASKIKWDSKLLEWKNIATEKQRFYYEFFRNRRWEVYEEPEQPYLKVKIGYALFGPPINVKDASVTIDNFYSPAQKKRIEDVFNAMKKVNKGDKNVIAGFLFFIATIDNKYTEFPVFRVLKKKQEDGSETCNFVDSFGYVYKNWEKFLSANIIPYCIYCYPKDGFYTCNESGDLELDFSYSPQSYSILGGVVSAVGTVGSAVGTVLPVGRSAQSDFLPIPLISVVKGIRGINKFTWIPVTSANGSADLYAVHFTQALAESSQCTEKIPLIINDGLEKGYINITWYAVINHISNIIQNSNKTTSMHLAQVVTSALFFCHSVPSSEITKIIIKEIRYERNNKSLNKLEHCKNIAVKNSLELKGKNPCNPIIKGLKFVDDRPGLMNELIEATFQTHFMIPDEDGKYHTLKELFEKIGASIETKKFADIITNYCLVLENTIRNCKNCSQIMETQGKFVGTLNKKFNTVRDVEKIKKEADIDEKEMAAIKKEINESDHLNSIQSTKLELNITDGNKNNNTSSPLRKDNPKSDTNTPESLKHKDKAAANDWLLVNIFNTIASPLITPPHKQKKTENQAELLMKEIIENTILQSTSKNAQPEIDSSVLGKEETPKKEKTKHFPEEVFKNPMLPKLNIDLKDICIPDTTNEPDNLKKNVNDYDLNINTPDLKVYNKVVPEFFKNDSCNEKEPNQIDNQSELNQAASPSCSKLDGSQTELTYSSETQNTKDEIIMDSKLDSIILNNEVESHEKQRTGSRNDNLSGKHFTITREYIPEQELAPLIYFKEIVQSELNNTEPLHYTIENENEGWQFVMPEEVLGVKIVKIIITERSVTDKKELLTINYY